MLELAGALKEPASTAVQFIRAAYVALNNITKVIYVFGIIMFA